MRIYFLLIFTAITLSFSTAYFALNLEKNNLALDEDIVQIEGLEDAFVNLFTPIALLDLSSMYPSRDFFQLLNPISIYSKNDVVVQDTFVSRPCLKNSERMSRQTFDKNGLWEDFRCHRITKLPENFFESPPLIHDSGLSFAYFAFLSGREPYSTVDWVKRNISYFHVFELKLLPETSIEGNFLILSLLSKDDFDQIVGGGNHIFSKDYYLTKRKNQNGILYNVYSRSVFEKFLKEKSFYISDYKPGSACFYQDGSACFEKAGNNFLQMYKRSSLVIFLTSMLVLFLVAIILFKKIRQQKDEEERKKHALRVLTHELRTPISNLLLQVEMINKQSDIIPGHILDEFLKMESEVYRLKRLAEKSSSYLQTHDRKGLIALEAKEFLSMNQMFAEMLEAYKDKNVQFMPLKNDESIWVDFYWLNICLKNLIENGLVHGISPVLISLASDKDYFFIHISNQGNCDFETLEEMLTTERVGKKNSSGLGVGLSIVLKIIKEMNGKLTFQKKPTTFTLHLLKRMENHH